MCRLNFCLVFGVILASNCVLSMHLRKDSYVKAHDNTRRVSPSISNDLFFSGLYNLKGKPHDLGSDFGLTSDVYTKPNPYYIKNAKNKTEPVHYPVYNHNNSVNQDAASEPTDDNFAPSSYDPKLNSYTGSYNVQSSPSYSSYSAPSSSYGTPSSSYGSPGSSYGSPGSSSYYPSPSYSSSSSYGQSPSPSYGVPASYYPSTTVVHQMPEAQKSSHSEWFLAKLMKKFDLILVSKIILKLIIFKKIVKFIGIICLLMFIPILKKKFEEHSGESDEEEERRIKPLDDYANVDFRLKEIMNFAATSIEGFQTNNIPWCVGESEFYCRLQYMLDVIDLRYTGYRILDTWFPDLKTTTPAPVKRTYEIEDDKSLDFNDYINESSELESLESNESSNEEILKKFKATYDR